MKKRIVRVTTLTSFAVLAVGILPLGAQTAKFKKGTGAYKDLHGAGKVHATLDSSSGAITAVYSGKAHVQNKT